MGNKLISCLLLVCGLAFGQRSDTVFKQVFANLSTSPVTSNDLPTIGQSQHVLYVKASNAPTKVCSSTSPTADIYFEASYDNASFFRLTGGSIVNVSTSNASVLYATGLAPHIRIKVATFDTVNCTLNVYYGGSLYPAFTDKMENTYLAQGLQTARFSQNVAGQYGVIAPYSDRSIAVYGLVCNNQTAQPIQIIGSINHSVYMGDNATFVWPPTGLPYMVVPPGFPFGIGFSNATYVTCFVSWRYE